MGLGRTQRVEVAARADGLALRPVHHQVDHRHVRGPLCPPEGGEGQQAHPQGDGRTAADTGERDHGHEGRHYPSCPHCPHGAESIWWSTGRTV